MSDFSILAQHHFGFLVHEYGFKSEVVSERLVVYENGLTFFQIGMGRRGEVGLTFDRYPPSMYFPFAFYLKTFFPDDAARLQEQATSSRLELDVALGELAGLLKAFGGPIITGQAKMFEKLTAKAAEML
jgi:hypothetical protein